MFYMISNLQFSTLGWSASGSFISLSLWKYFLLFTCCWFRGIGLLKGPRHVPAPPHFQLTSKMPRVAHNLVQLLSVPLEHPPLRHRKLNLQDPELQQSLLRLQQSLNPKPLPRHPHPAAAHGYVTGFWNRTSNSKIRPKEQCEIMRSVWSYRHPLKHLQPNQQLLDSARES